MSESPSTPNPVQLFQRQCADATARSDWPALLSAARAVPRSEVPIVSRYCEAYALYHLSQKTVTPEIMELTQETLLLIYARPTDGKVLSGRPSVQDKVILFFIHMLGLEALQKQEDHRALVYFTYLMLNGLEKNYFAQSEVFSHWILLLHRLGWQERAYQYLYYAHPRYLDQKLLSPLLVSGAYQKFSDVADLYASPPEELALYGQGQSPADAVQQMANLRYSLLTPLEAFADQSIEFAYPTAFQNSPCVLRIEQDVHWQGNFIIDDIASYLGVPLEEQPLIIQIKGDLIVEGHLVCAPKSTPAPRVSETLHTPKLREDVQHGMTPRSSRSQLLIDGDVHCKIFYNQQRVSIRGTLHCDMQILDGDGSALHADWINTAVSFAFGGYSCSLQARYTDKRVAQHERNSQQLSLHFLRDAFSTHRAWHHPGELGTSEVTSLCQKINDALRERTAYSIHLMLFKDHGEPTYLCRKKVFAAIERGLPLLKVAI